MSGPKKARWTIASARQHLPLLVDLAVREPQEIYRRNELVARVINPGAPAVAPLKPSASELIARIHRACVADGYDLPVAPRINRQNAFVNSRPARRPARLPGAKHK
jgi:hypothetical protein